MHFAAILQDGSVVAWGNSGFGGDCRAVQNQLRDVQQIQASRGAFAAIVGDRSVVTWGDAANGGGSSVVQEQRETCSRSKLVLMHLLQSWVMDLLSPAVATAMPSRSS